MSHPEYEIALGDPVLYAKYFTFGNSQAEFFTYIKLSDIQEETRINYIGEFSDMLTWYRTYLNILSDSIMGQERLVQKFRDHMVELLHADVCKKLNESKLSKLPCKSYLQNCLTGSKRRAMRVIDNES